jgi:hypothetical protein
VFRGAIVSGVRTTDPWDEGPIADGPPTAEIPCTQVQEALGSAVISVIGRPRIEETLT